MVLRKVFSRHTFSCLQTCAKAIAIPKGTVEQINRNMSDLISKGCDHGKNKNSGLVNHAADNVVVCIEGNIGCGKSTLLNHFTETANCEVLIEPVDKWRNLEGYNLLELMYEDPSRWGMSLQTYIQLTMLQHHTKTQTHSVRLMERSIYSAKYCFTDHLYNSGKMSQLDHIILTEWFNWIIQSHYIKVDLIVYLRTDPEKLHSRIRQRGRKEEDAIQLELLKSIHQLYEDWLIDKKKYCPAEILVIDANPPLEDMQAAYSHHRKKILLQN